MAGDGPGPLRTGMVALLLTGVMVSAGVAASAVTGVDATAAIGAAAVALLVGLVLLRFATRRSGGDGDVWEPIAGDQYVGRPAEAGGFARQEQERALDEADERAEAVEDDSRE